MLRDPSDADNPPGLGQFEGQRRKDAALNSHETRYTLELLIVRNRFVERLLSHGPTSLSELDLPPWLCGPFLGSVHRPFANAGMIVERRMVKNRRPNCKARRIVEWELKAPEAVRQWLVNNPIQMPLATPVDAVESSEAAPVTDVGKSGATPQRSLFDEEG